MDADSNKNKRYIAIGETWSSKFLEFLLNILQACSKSEERVGALVKNWNTESWNRLRDNPISIHTTEFIDGIISNILL